MEIFQKVLELPISDRTIGHAFTDITNHIQEVVSDLGLNEGIVLVHTLHTTTGLAKGDRNPLCGLLVQENEPLLLADMEQILKEGAEKFLEALPHIVFDRERFLDFVPKSLLDKLLKIFIAILRPSGYFQHDDFKIRTENMTPGEKKNAVAHLETAMLREMIVWSFSGGKLNLGEWQKVFLCDFDPQGRKSRKIQVVVVGKKA